MSRRWWRGRPAKLWVGVVLVSLFVLMALGSLLISGDPAETSGDLLQPPSAAHLLGTTNSGQDVFAQLVVGSRGSLVIGVAAAVLATALSIVIGVGGGYLGGRMDEALSLLSNVALVIPALPLAIVVARYIPTRGLLPIIIVIAVVGWAGTARVLRAQTLSLRERDFVAAAKVAGEPTWRIVLFEVLPNLLPVIGAQFIFAVTGAVLAEAGLSFLGLGDISANTWGTMLYFAQNDFALIRGAWWWFAPPGLCIALLGAGLSLINLGMDEVSNPRLRGVRALKAKRADSRVVAPATPMAPAVPDVADDLRERV